MKWPWQKSAQQVAANQARRAQRAFDAAGTGRLLSAWVRAERSIHEDIRNDLDKLRTRARDLAQNNAYAKRYLSMVVANVVGPNGFTLQARVYDSPNRQDVLANVAIESAWREWCHACDLRGQSFLQLQRQIMRAVARDGEALVRLVTVDRRDNRFGIVLQHLDVCDIDTQLCRERSANYNQIISGIEIDAMRRPVAYHMRPKVDGTRLVLRADEVLHLYDPDRADQVRGVPWMHAAMVGLHHLGEFEQSALTAARKGANTLGFFVSPDGSPPLVDETSTDDEPIQVSVEGSFDTLPEGYDFRPYASQYPNEVFPSFVKSALRRVASALNVSYNTLANDLEGVNFSSIRTGVLEEREQWMGVQQWFIDCFLRPVYLHWLNVALLGEQITFENGAPLPSSAEKIRKFSSHTWQARRWEWVDPLKDIEADIRAVDARLKAPQDIAAKMGADYEDVLMKIKQAQDLAEQLGLSAAGGHAPLSMSAPTEEDG